MQVQKWKLTRCSHNSFNVVAFSRVPVEIQEGLCFVYMHDTTCYVILRSAAKEQLALRTMWQVRRHATKI